MASEWCIVLVLFNVIPDGFFSFFFWGGGEERRALGIVLAVCGISKYPS